MKAALLVLLSSCLLTGCRVGRPTFVEPVTDKVLEVKSGDRIAVELKENATTGYTWVAESDDDDVEIAYERIPPDTENGLCGAPGKVRIVMRVHRGFAGPATVTMRYRRPWNDDTARVVKFSLFRYPNDAAPWK